MSKKQYLICKLISVAVLGAVVGTSVNLGNYLLPLIAIVAAWGFLYIIQGKVKEVLADERDYLIAGKAARVSLAVYAMIMSVLGVTLMALSKTRPELESSAMIVLYPVCGLIFLNAVLFKIYNKRVK